MSQEEIGRLRRELLARRSCFVGARQDVEMAVTTLENAADIDLARTSLLSPLRERLELLDLAINQVDEALR